MTHDQERLLQEAWNSYFWDGIEAAHDGIEAGVLRNKGKKLTRAELEEFERTKSGERQSEIFENGLEGLEFTPDGYRKIHQYLFQDVYDWAGKHRKCVLAKPGAQFVAPEYVSTYLEDIFAELVDIPALQALSATEFSEKAGAIVNRLNRTHPFREGNGRTNRTFLRELGLAVGHEVDLNKIDANQWMEASVVGHRLHNPTLFAEIIENAIGGGDDME